MKRSTELLTLFAGLVFSHSSANIQTNRDGEKQIMGMPTKDTPPFEDMTTIEIIQYWGYPAEIYHTTTEDGFILELHRIPYGISGQKAGGPVVFVQHGLLCSSSDWVMDKPGRALAYLLADAGYDVWLGNVRGNTYSRNHTNLDPEKKEFWQWTWHDSAIYDITASIDFALELTGQSQVYYIGFSMGTTMFFVMMSERNDYASKITAAALMGPVAYDAHMKGLFGALSPYSEKLDRLLSLSGHSEILASGPKTDFVVQSFCPVDEPTSAICSNLLFLICGFDPTQLNPDYLPIILSHTPAGSSVHTANHYAQLIPNGTFQNYDWGRKGNQDHYGSNDIPVYNLSVKTPPIALYWGQNDWLATPEDLERTASELTNVVVNHRVEWDTWNHLDFTWGINAKEYVYDHVIDFISQYR